jgi:hypothetical protein
MRPRAPRALLLGAALGLGLGPAGAAPPGREPGQVVRVEHRDPDTVPSRGPASAPVTIEYFFLPTTNTQSRLQPYRMIEKLQQSHPARIRVIYRIVRRNAQVQLPTMALEAHAQGKFFELMDELHRSRTATTLGEKDIYDLAKKIEMDVPRLAAAIKNNRYGAVLEANEHRIDRIIRGQASTPAVLFNDKVPRTGVGSMSDADYEREYKDAYERAQELLDRGVEPRSLMEAFDTLALRSTQPFVGSGPTDNDPSGDALDHRLASPPLPLAGLPSYGKTEATGAIPVVLLCRPNDTSACSNSMQQLRKLQNTYPDEVRLVWAPWFDVSRDDAADLTMLGDAALCAEEIGSNAGDLNASPGWRWIEKQLGRAKGSRGRRSPPEKLIDELAAEVDLDPQRLSACRARMASATIDWIERARRSGVTRAPALIIGGRIYEGIPDQGVIQQLIEAELAPGVLGELAPVWPQAHR